MVKEPVYDVTNRCFSSRLFRPGFLRLAVFSIVVSSFFGYAGIQQEANAQQPSGKSKSASASRPMVNTPKVSSPKVSSSKGTAAKTPAKTTAKTATSATESKSPPILAPVNTYRLGPQDSFRVTVKNYPEFDQAEVIVPPDGKVAIPGLGTFQVNKKTREQVEAEVRAALRREMRNPQVTVTLMQLRPAAIGYVYIVGSVATPGTVEIREGFRLTEVLAAGGGVQGQLEDISATLTRGKQNPVPINLVEAVSHPSTSVNQRVYPGDVITLLSIKSPQLMITGVVAKPGVYKMRRVPQPAAAELPLQPRVLDAIVAAGGVVGRSGEVQGYITRTGQAAIPIDVFKILSKPTDAVNVALLPDDVLTFGIVEPARIIISGAVARPSVYELHRIPQPNALELALKPRLSDAIIAAGGLSKLGSSATPTPALSGIGTGDSVASPPTQYKGFVQRGGQRIELQVENALENPDSGANIELQPNDFLSFEVVIPPPPLPPLTIFVDGFIQKPGTLQTARGSRVFEAIMQAGGLTQPIEKIEASIRRGNETLPVDLNRVMLNTDEKANFLLHEGDVVQLREPPVIRVQVAGGFVRPGPLRLPPKSTLLEAIQQAGGLSIKAEDARLNILRRTDDGRQIVANVDPVTLIELRDIKQNLILQDGDLINVTAKRSRTVFVSGEIARPGSYEIKEGEGLPALLTRAGGVTEAAAITRIAVQRGNSSEVVNALPAIKEGKPLDFPLNEGDVIVVPKNVNRVLLMEAVARPGYYSIPEGEGLTLLDVLGQAGGPGPRTKEVVLLRQTPTGIDKRVIPIEEVRSGKAAKEPLQNGDVVYVPPINAKTPLITKLMSTLGIFRIFMP